MAGGWEVENEEWRIENRERLHADRAVYGGGGIMRRRSSRPHTCLRRGRETPGREAECLPLAFTVSPGPGGKIALSDGDCVIYDEWKKTP